MPVGDKELEAAVQAPAQRENGESREERAARIARIQKEIAAGIYQIDAAKLAARIVEAHLKPDK